MAVHAQSNSDLAEVVLILPPESGLLAKGSLFMEIEDWMFHSNEHLTPASGQKTLKGGRGLSGATLMGSVYRDARLKLK